MSQWLWRPGSRNTPWHCDRHASASRVGKAGVGSHSTPWLQCHCTIQFAKVAELPDAPGFRSAFSPKLYRGARERKLTQSQAPPFTAKGKKVTGSGKADRPEPIPPESHARRKVGLSYQGTVKSHSLSWIHRTPCSAKSGSRSHLRRTSFRRTSRAHY